MSITVTIVDEDIWGKTRVILADILLDSSYPTNGYTAALGFTPRAFGLKTIADLLVTGINGAGSGIVQIVFDKTNAKLLAFRTALGTVVGNVTVVGGGIGEAIGINPDTNAGVLSKAAATNRTIPIATFLGAAPTIAQGSLAEVTNTTNLSAVTIRCRVFEKNFT